MSIVFINFYINIILSNTIFNFSFSRFFKFTKWKYYYGIFYCWFYLLCI